MKASLHLSPGGLRRVLLIGCATSAMAVTIAVPPAPRLVWNASASAPIGLYRVRPGAQPARGAMVVARIPQAYRQLAAVRHYLPGNVPLVKRVAAKEGDRICARDTAILVDGRRVASRLASDGKGRVMPWWHGCRTLGRGEYFLLMARVPGSFDGRYFGVTGKNDIVGEAYPLWTR